MKKNYIRLASFGAIICAALSFTACAEVEPVDTVIPDKEISEGKTITVNFECSLPDEDEATRTEFHGNTIWWSVNDKIKYLEFGAFDGKAGLISGESIIDNDTPVPQQSATLNFSAPDNINEAAFFSVFPSSSLIACAVSNNRALPCLTLISTQNPSATGYDSNADLLVSQYVMATDLETDSNGGYIAELRYKRMVAIAKMTLVNLPSTKNVESIVFSSKINDAEVEIAGTRYYDLVNGIPSSITSDKCKKEYAINLDYSGQNITASGSTGMTAYFMCYPFELAPGDSFKVVVTTTAGEIFTREVTIPSGRSLEFKEGKGSIFSVNMADATKTSAIARYSNDGGSTWTYTTNLVDAINAANEMSTECEIELLDDYTNTTAVSVTNSNGVTLDLNGHTLTISTNKRISPSENGRLIIDGDGKYTDSMDGSNIFNYSSGTLILKNATISYDGATSSESKATGVYVQNTATFEMQGGTINVGTGGTALGVAGSSQVKITGGEITCEKFGISMSGSADVTVSGTAKVTSTGSNAIAASAGTLTIEGGYFAGKGINNYAAVYTSATSTATVEISGGYYSKAPVDKLLKTGYVCAANIDANTMSQYPITVISNVTLTIGSGAPQPYSSVEDAMAATDNAEADCVIKLHGDCTLSAQKGVKNTNHSVTLDLNDHTLAFDGTTRILLNEDTHLIIEDSGVNQSGKITNGAFNVFVISKGKLTVNGGEIVNTSKAAIYLTGGEVIINGGKVTAPGSNAIFATSAGSLTINAGYIAGKGVGDTGTSPIFRENASAQFNIFGGYYSKAVNSAYLTDAYECVDNTDSTTSANYPKQVKEK